MGAATAERIDMSDDKAKPPLTHVCGVDVRHVPGTDADKRAWAAERYQPRDER